MRPYPGRRAAVLAWMGEKQLDLFVVSARPNLRYLTGFTGEGAGVLSAETMVVITDRRYEVEAAEELADCEVRFAEAGYLQEVGACLEARAPSRAGFEAEHLRVASHQKLSSLCSGVEFVPTEQVVENHRAMKDADEIEAVRQAVRVADVAIQSLLGGLDAGVSERELALQLRCEVIQAGGEDVSFEPVVAFGPNSAKAHAAPSERRLASGDLVLVDCGARVAGYCSDITRTVTLGPPGEQFGEIYHTVRSAQQAALAALGPGAAAVEVDARAREVIDAGDYHGKFGHSVGHGVGLEVHEAPRLGRQSTDVLVPGNVVTLEPGIYTPGWGGVRLEEMVLITETGAQVLTQAPYLDL